MARRKKKPTTSRAAATDPTSADATRTALPAIDTNEANNIAEPSANNILKLKIPSIGSHPSSPRHSADENDKEANDFAEEYAAREDALTNEELYLICKYQALLILTLHKAKPFVYLDHPDLIRELDTFHSGYLNEDGLEMRHAPYRDEEGVKRYYEMRAKVAARLAEHISERAEANYREEPKNRVIDDKNPEHAAFTRVIISAKHFKDWCAIIKNPKYNGDKDYPEKSKPVSQHLRKVVDGQYDYNIWHHFPPKPQFNQVPRFLGEVKNEELQYTTSYPDKILAVVDVKIPGTDKRFYQMDVFNDIPKPMKVSRQKSRHPEVYYLPCPDVFIIPKPLMNKRWAGKADWVLSEHNPKLWERADGKGWLARIGTRMFDNKTHEYLEFCHPDPAWLRDVNPNDAEWRKKYNDFFHGLGGDYSEEEKEVEDEVYGEEEG